MDESLGAKMLKLVSMSIGYAGALCIMVLVVWCGAWFAASLPWPSIAEFAK